MGRLTAFFWSSLVHGALLHHVTWSVNSICHMIGDRPYEARDKSANFRPLAIASMGDGVRRGQIDISASSEPSRSSAGSAGSAGPSRNDSRAG